MAKLKDLDKALKIAEEGAKIARAEKKAMRMSEALDPHVGKRLYITQADRMALDPTKGYLGGSGFIDLATMLPEYKGMAWAVKTPGIAKTMVGSMARNPEEAIWTNLQGSPAQHRSNQVVFDKIMSEFRNAVEEGKLTPELRDKINKKLASIKIAKTDIPMFPSDVDILSPNFAKHANVFHKRREIASVLGGEGVGGKKGTIIPYEKIIEETTDPLVKDVQTGSIGNRLFSLTGDIFPERPDIHTAYPTALGGEKLSDVFTPAPQEIVLKEVYKNYKRKPTYYDLTRGHAPSAKITDEMLEDLYKSGYAGGGPIKALDKALKVGEKVAKETLKKAKDYKPTKSELSELAKDVMNAKGQYGVQRMERAFDLVPNLEKQFSPRALEQAFIDDNASSLLILPPKDFEKFAAPLPEWYGKSIEGIKFEGGKQVPITMPPLEESYLIKSPHGDSYEEKMMAPEEYFKHLGTVAREHGFNDIPFLKFDKGSYRDPTMVITGHEGRHRSRALNRLGDKATLVKLYPRYSFREDMPRSTQEEYLQALEEMFGQKSLVEPQGALNPKTGKFDPRSLERLPEFFAEGGTTADGGSSHKQGKPLDFARGPRSTKSDVELLDEFNKDELTARDYFKAVPTIAKTTGKMLKEQAKEELPTYLEPRAIPDIALNALATGIGSISDLAHLGTGVERPVLGSEQLMDLLSEYGITSGTKRPLAENLLAVASPKVLRTAEQGLNKLVPIAKRSFTPLTTTVEAVAPDLAKFRPRDFQEYITNRLISNQYGGTPMNFMGDEITKKLPAQGVYFNEAGELETNPMMAIDIPNIKDVSKAKALRADIASAGKALNQESMAGIRFLPLATNKLEDATAILVKPKSGKISNEDVIKLGNEFGNSMVVSHNPRLGGVVLAPFDKPSGELQSAQSKIKDLFGSDMNIKAGHSDLQKDRFYMPKSDYQKEGARKVPKSTKAVREELKKAESLRYREPSFLSDTNPLSGGVGD